MFLKTYIVYGFTNPTIVAVPKPKAENILHNQVEYGLEAFDDENMETNIGPYSVNFDTKIIRDWIRLTKEKFI